MKQALHVLGGAALAAAAVTGCAHDLAPGAAESPVLSLRAAGVQVYECRAEAGWQLLGPEADLYNPSGQRVGRHYAGPTWEALDGSRVTGSVSRKLASASADSIPQLLLAAQPAGRPGVLERVSSIQRLDVVGGSAPQGGCSPQAAGALARVPYAALYVFFTRKTVP